MADVARHVLAVGNGLRIIILAVALGNAVLLWECIDHRCVVVTLALAVFLGVVDRLSGFASEDVAEQ